MKRIALKEAWMIKDDKIIHGTGFVANVFGWCSDESEEKNIFFDESGIMSEKESSNIFFDIDSAYREHRRTINRLIEMYEKDLEDDEKRLFELKNIK